MASRTCWNCSETSHQTPRSAAAQASDKQWHMAYSCDGCGVMTVGIAALPDLEPHHGSIAKDRMDQPHAAIEWQPIRMLGRRFDNVPHPIDAAASEAWACYSIGQYRASVLMARAVVEATAKEKGFTNGQLVTKIDKLYENEIIGKGVKEAAHEIRFIGNEMAHGDFVTPVSEEECSDVLTFLEEFLTEVYERPARLGAFRAKRLTRNTT